MIGIYQCYCSQLGLFGTLEASNSICGDYYFKWLGGGATLISIFGIVIGLINTVSYFIIKLAANIIGFRTVHVKSRFIMVTAFIITFLNSSIVCSAFF
jgi:hypothetical protein